MKDLTSATFQNQLFCPILSIMKKEKFANASVLLQAILDGVPVEQITCHSKLISKLIGVSLV